MGASLVVSITNDEVEKVCPDEYGALKAHIQGDFFTLSKVNNYFGSTLDSWKRVFREEVAYGDIEVADDDIDEFATTAYDLLVILKDAFKRKSRMNVSLETFSNWDDSGYRWELSRRQAFDLSHKARKLGLNPLIYAEEYED